jgi:cell wall-associated NlpC family hydrolase
MSGETTVVAPVPARRRLRKLAVRALLAPAVVGAVTTGLSGTAHAATARQLQIGRHAVSLALKERGKPYVWGGAGPNSFDCSGLVMYVFDKLGIRLPHNAELQYRDSHHTGSGLVKRWSWVQPGYLIFFGSNTGDIYHVGIYVGHHEMVDAPAPGQRVEVQSIWSTHVYAGHLG